MKALLYSDIDISKFIIENPLPKTFGKVAIPKNIFTSDKVTEFPDFMYFSYQKKEELAILL